MTIAAATYTPPWLAFDAYHHVYSDTDDRTARLLSVTEVLQAAGLVDSTYFTDDARWLGTQVHQAIALFEDGSLPPTADPHVAPAAWAYLRGYQAFLAETAYVVHASEERLADRTLGVAGTCDLRGSFVRDGIPDAVDLIDIKTGDLPRWIGYQLAGYAQLLPPDVRARVRRYGLQLRPDGTYRLRACVVPSDAAVFLAAITITKAKRGWL